MNGTVPEIDPNKIIAELTVRGASEISEAVFGPTASRIRRAYQKVTNAYKPFMEQTYRRVSTVKTFLKSNEPVDLLNIFVPLHFRFGEKIVDQSTIHEVLDNGGKIIVSALAGRGKSVFMRYLATTLYHSGKGQIPLFIELRSLNNLTSKEILPYIHSTYQGSTSIKYADFLEAMKSNLFVIILDGFDEVDHDSRKEIETQIIEFSYIYPSLSLIVSGRPDERFESWEKFLQYQICPMNIGQVKEMIKKCDYDNETRKAFIKKLTPDFFEEHESFLSTPLLAILLMLTFEMNAEIPKTIHTFYENAFATLVRRHDAQKALFLRKTYTGCSVDEFAKIFSAFCFLTYAKSEFQFSENQILDSIEKALNNTGIKVTKEDILRDFIESICLLQKEGLEYSFVHRSFQEYFTAVFLSKSPSVLVEKYLDSQMIRPHDGVIPMWFQMDRDRLERDWCLAAIQSLIKIFNHPNRNHNFIDIAVDRIDYFYIDGVIVYKSLNWSKTGFKIVVLRQMYPHHFSAWMYFSYFLQRVEKKETEQVEKVLVGCKKAGDDRFQSLLEEKKKSAKADGSNAVPVIRIKTRDGDHKLYDDLGLTALSEKILPVLAAIEQEVHERVSAGDMFVDDIFNTE